MKWYEYILIVAAILWVCRRVRMARAGLDPETAARAGLAAERAQGILDSLELASKASPGSARTHAARGRALCDVGRHAEALEAYGLARGLDPSLDVGAARGRALLGLGRHAEALAELEAAVHADAGDAEAHADLARALAGVGRHGEALGHADRAISIGPDRAEFHACRGRILGSLGRAREAREASARARGMNRAAAWPAARL